MAAPEDNDNGGGKHPYRIPHFYGTEKPAEVMTWLDACVDVASVLKHDEKQAALGARLAMRGLAATWMRAMVRSDESDLMDEWDTFRALVEDQFAPTLRKSDASQHETACIQTDKVTVAEHFVNALSSAERYCDAMYGDLKGTPDPDGETAIQKARRLKPFYDILNPMVHTKFIHGLRPALQAVVRAKQLPISKTTEELRKLRDAAVAAEAAQAPIPTKKAEVCAVTTDDTPDSTEDDPLLVEIINRFRGMRNGGFRNNNNNFRGGGRGNRGGFRSFNNNNRNWNQNSGNNGGSNQPRVTFAAQRNNGQPTRNPQSGGRGNTGSGTTGARCYNCNKVGHLAAQCRSPPRRGGDINAVDTQKEQRPESTSQRDTRAPWDVNYDQDF